MHENKQRSRSAPKVAVELATLEAIYRPMYDDGAPAPILFIIILY